MKVLAVVPARGGSKSIPRKNLVSLGGRPLLAYAVRAALAARRVDRVVVSTDDAAIAEVARAWGAEVPFLRPPELATDDVSLVPVVRHAMEEMDRRGFPADAVVSIQPTSPFVEGEDVDRAVALLAASGADAVASVARVEHEHPLWARRLEGDRVLPFDERTDESYLQRQDLPPAYVFDGALFVRRRAVLEAWGGGDFGLGRDVRGIVLGGAKSIHIDDPVDLELARAWLRRRTEAARRPIRIGERLVGPGAPAFLLAEIASAHQGRAEEAIALARAAQRAGADGVKFQLFRAAELVAPTDPRREVFERIELRPDEWESVLAEASRLGIPVLADVFDRASLELAERCGVAAYKIHSTDLETPALLRAAAATGKPLLLATGGSDLGVVEWALDTVRAAGARDVVLLHGVQSFPTRIDDAHLRFLPTLRERFGLPVGFLDHVDGGSPMALVLPALALAFGAELIEKHVTRDRAAKGFDYESALEPDRFAEMVRLVRETERALGSADEPCGPAAARYHRAMRRAALAGRALDAGARLGPGDVVLLRSETGLSPRAIEGFYGRRLRRAVEPYEPLTEELFDEP